MQEVKAKKPAAGVARHESIAEPQGTIRRDLTVRGKKPKTTERTGKGDGSTVLVNDLIGLTTAVWMLTGLTDKQ